MSDEKERCTPCYGTGEIVTEQGALACPDCFGDGRGAKVEWRLRSLDKQYGAIEGELAADMRWLIHEVRRYREALVQILSRCQDADESDPLATDVKYQANEALGLYVPSI
jgi:hypothetical protein